MNIGTQELHELQMMAETGEYDMEYLETLTPIKKKVFKPKRELED